MDVSSASSASVYAPQTAYSLELAKNLARVRELVSVVSDNKRSVGEQMEAYHEIRRLGAMGKTRGLSEEDQQPLRDLSKTDFMKRFFELNNEMYKVMDEAGDRIGAQWRNAVSFYDSLSADDQVMLFGSLNCPCYNDLARMEIDVPPQPYNSAEDWRAASIAQAAMEDFYDTYVAGANGMPRENLPPDVQAMWDKVRVTERTHENNRDGSWAKEMMRILAQPLDKVEISPEAKLLMNREAKLPKLEADKLGETNESIALMVLEKAQEARDAKEGKDETVRERERPAFTAQRAQGSIVDVSA